jgi:(3,5-dihydroxyphenyl)acetyl-CoA 1,2-dioxygenase
VTTSPMGQWPVAMPEPGRTLDDDATALAEYTGAGERLVAALPARPDRDAEQARLACAVFESCRELRHRFMRSHADEVYDTLTQSRTVHHRLTTLVQSAAETFSGLVPTGSLMDAERKLVQADKDGREIDQGIFVHWLLRSPSVGRHLMNAMLLPTDRARELLPEFRRAGVLDLGSVLLERRDFAAHLTIENQHCLNAEDDRLVADLETAVDLAALDEQVRVCVLRGGVMTKARYRGKRVFSSGINLRDLHDGRISYIEFLLTRELGCLSKILHGVRTDPSDGALPASGLQKPWIAAVDSFAIGGGMQLLLLFDWVIAGQDAYFSLPAAQEGIVPGAGSLRLARFTGSRLSRRIVLGGRKILAKDPDGLLLCDEVVPADEIDSSVERAVALLDNPATVANRRMLTLAEEDPDRFRAYMAEFAWEQALRLYSDDVLDKVGRWQSETRASV